MKSLTILPVVAFFGTLVAGVPLSDLKSGIMPLTFGQVCVVCETMPQMIRKSCYSHCQAVTKAWAVNNTVVINNTTVSASVMRSAFPVASNTTSTVYLDLNNFSADAIGICTFCNDYSGKLRRKCHRRCRKHSPTKVSSALKADITDRPTPISIDGIWDFCFASCKEHHCDGPYFGQCISQCYLCFAEGISPRWHMFPEWPVWDSDVPQFEPTACFCPAVEFGDRWQDDQDRYEDQIDEEFAHDDDYSSDDRTDAENDW